MPKKNTGHSSSKQLITVRGIGDSMSPFLYGGNVCIIKPNSNNRYEIGDIVFFLSPKNNQKYIIHRIIKKDHNMVLTKGDGEAFADGWINRRIIKGKVIAFKKQNKLINLETKRLKILSLILAYFSAATINRKNITALLKSLSSLEATRLLFRFFFL